MRAHAKSNLLLRVFSPDPSGFHSLETLLIRLELHDSVQIVDRDENIALEVEGEAASDVPADRENLCWRAARSFFERAGPEAKGRRSRGVAIRLTKRIPTGAGLGGGSADAAAVLSALNHRARRPLGNTALLDLAGALGSDVPFALLGVPMALGWERGRRLLPLQPPATARILVLMPPFSVSTAHAYGWLRNARTEVSARERWGAAAIPGVRRLARWDTLARLSHNDFEEPVFERHPELAACREILERAGALTARLSGSGAALVASFQREEQRETAVRQTAEAGFGEAGGWQVIRTLGPV